MCNDLAIAIYVVTRADNGIQCRYLLEMTDHGCDP